MWKLKIGEGGSPWLRTLNGHTGRQHWEFDPDLGSPEDLEAVENAREEFRKNRFHQKHSADLLMRIQFNKDNRTRIVLPQVKVTDTEDITEDQVTATLRRALSFHSTLQAHDGHWPGDYGGPMFLMPGLNSDGGFATYELTRSYSWLELFNPAETFGDIVIDYPYVECSSAAIQALASFKKLYPGHRREEIESCIERAALFIEKKQAPDGSWFIIYLLVN
ncbi:hypothetical protein RHSIM_Rhsim01G0108900 [Rhododendron simsii]|uniref:Cycloartenol synthase n=1 Tax=Rhododendron simsii TaxID=118357 RepID=A0A834HHE9_RHOSS|nr:hypothetical protein RHSIM_Rhsim01G0108900 [Rhododendron simsii]